MDSQKHKWKKFTQLFLPICKMNNQITVCLTSCSRFDLLERTVKSLIQFWDGPRPKAFFIYEDSFPLSDVDYQKIVDIMRVVNDRGVPFSIFTNKSGKNGQIRAIDILYQNVQTPYIYHMEDDFETFRTGFVQKSLSVLEENPNIMQVWLRSPNDRNGHRCVGVPKMTKDRTRYQMLSAEYMNKWSGFSLNPGLRRLSDYQNLFPNGYSGVTAFDPKNPLKSEIEIGQVYKRNGFRAATLLEGYVRHIGNGRHVKP